MVDNDDDILKFVTLFKILKKNLHCDTAILYLKTKTKLKLN